MDENNNTQDFDLTVIGVCDNYESCVFFGNDEKICNLLYGLKHPRCPAKIHRLNQKDNVLKEQ